MEASGGHLQSTVPAPVNDVQVVENGVGLHQVKTVVAETPKNSSGGMTLGTMSASPDPNSDAASIHSMPAVHTSEPAWSVAQGPSLVSAESSPLSTRPSPASPSRSNTMHEGSSNTQQQRRGRHRSAIEVRFCILQTLSSSYQGRCPASVAQPALRVLQQFNASAGSSILFFPRTHSSISSSVRTSSNKFRGRVSSIFPSSPSSHDSPATRITPTHFTGTRTFSTCNDLRTFPLPF